MLILNLVQKGCFAVSSHFLIATKETKTHGLNPEVMSMDASYPSIIWACRAPPHSQPAPALGLYCMAPQQPGQCCGLSALLVQALPCCSGASLWAAADEDSSPL